MYEIEHNVPIPVRWADRFKPKGTPARYRWGRLDIGDSFFVPCDCHDDQIATRMRLLASCGRFGKRRGWKFTTRLEGLGVRIWRVE